VYWMMKDPVKLTAKEKQIKAGGFGDERVGYS
jgi:hypothetical protein